MKNFLALAIVGFFSFMLGKFTSRHNGLPAYIQGGAAPIERDK